MDIAGAGQLPTNTAIETAVDQLFYVNIIFISYINNSINFLMYLISGRKFRLAALDTVTCRWFHGGRVAGNSTVMDTSNKPVFAK